MEDRENEQLDRQIDEMLENTLVSAANKIERKKMAAWIKGLLITIAVILLLFLLFAIAGGIFANHLLDSLGKYDPSNDTTISQDQVSPDSGSIPVEPGEDLPNIDELPTPPGGDTVEKQKDVVNILVVGQDSYNTTVRSRSDTMIMITVHTKAKKVTVTSFLRDAYVKIPGYPSNKLNHAFELGGLKLLNETLLVNFGVEIDGNVLIDFSSFKKIIDLLGGVDISLTYKEAEYLVNGGRHDVHVGMNRLTGAQALDYARLREIDSDYQRTNRQRTVILSIINRYKSLPLDQMIALMDDILPMIVTDMEKAQIVEYALKCAPVAASASYGTQQIPANKTFDQGYVRVREDLKNWFQYNIDFDANRKILQDIMNGK